MARQEDAECGAAADLGVEEDEAVGLLDDAIDRREAEAGAFADLLGGEERLENLLDDVGRNAGAGVAHFDQDIFSGRQRLVAKSPGIGRGYIRRPYREFAALRHRVAGIHGEVHDHLLELRDVDAHRPKIAPVVEFERHFLADQPSQQHRQVGQYLAKIEHLRPQRLPPRERQ